MTALYFAVACAVTVGIRVLPLTLMRKRIKNRFLISFLYYVPYVTLAVMTFPAMMDATRSPWAGLAALVCGVVLAFRNASLLTVACACCAIVFGLELIL